MLCKSLYLLCSVILFEPQEILAGKQKILLIHSTFFAVVQSVTNK